MAESKEPTVGQTNANLGGRPFKFTSVKELQTKIDAYFAECDPHPIEVTEYVWNTIDVTYTDKKGNQKTRKENDYSRPPETKTKWVVSQPESYSITGLALALDTTRRTLLDYEYSKYVTKEDDDNYDPEYNALLAELTHTIKKAKVKIEHQVQQRLEGNAVTGTIFNLKNNFDWVDRSETDGTQEIVVTTRKHKRKTDGTA